LSTASEGPGTHPKHYKSALVGCRLANSLSKRGALKRPLPTSLLSVSAGVMQITALVQGQHHPERVENGELPSDRWRYSMLNFLAVELESARIFVELSVRIENPGVQANYLPQALKAYEVVLRFSNRVPLLCSEKQRIQEGLDFLGSRLERRTEETGSTSVIPWSMTSPLTRNESLGRRVARFLAHCEEVRANARRMVIQNYTLMGV